MNEPQKIKFPFLAAIIPMLTLLQDSEEAITNSLNDSKGFDQQWGLCAHETLRN